MPSVILIQCQRRLLMLSLSLTKARTILMNRREERFALVLCSTCPGALSVLDLARGCRDYSTNPRARNSSLDWTVAGVVCSSWRCNYGSAVLKLCGSGMVRLLTVRWLERAALSPDPHQHRTEDKDTIHFFKKGGRPLFFTLPNFMDS